MTDKHDSLPCVVKDPAISAVAAGAFFVCDSQGHGLLAGEENLLALFGPVHTDIDLADHPDLPKLLAIIDREGWESLFAPGDMAATREDSLRYAARDGSQRWLRVRHRPLSGHGSQIGRAHV